MLLGPLFLVVLTPATEPPIVVEGQVQGEESQAALGAELAQALAAPSPAQAAGLIRERLPPVAGPMKVEPVIEANQLVEKGRDAYLDGRFPEATQKLEQALGVLRRAIESLDEERKAAETLFRAHMYLAFTLRAEGGGNLPQAVEAMKEAIRTFPSLEPSRAEFGPENLSFYRRVKQEMEQAPTGSLHVRTPAEPANVYLNGRLVGVTPLDLQRVYGGRYLIHLRRGTEPSRLHAIEIRPGENHVRIDLGFEQALRTDDQVALVFASEATRRAQYRQYAAELARSVAASEALVYWMQSGRVQLAYVDANGNARFLACAREEAAKRALELREGRAGEFVKGEVERPRRLWTWVASGVAVGALAIGVGLGLSAHSDFDDLNRRFPTGAVTDPAALETRDGASSKQTAANVLVSLGAVAALGAGFLYWYEGRSAEAARAHLAPVVAPSYAGAEWRLRF